MDVQVAEYMIMNGEEEIFLKGGIKIISLKL